MKLFVTGKTGQLGSSLVKDATELGYDVVAPSRQEFDISDKNRFIELVSIHKPDIVINTAAMTNVYECETDAENAFKYNSIAVYNMARICHNQGIRFVTISSDYVFSGTKKEPYIETDISNPIQVYGISKLAGEFATLLHHNMIVIRTSGLYGPIETSSRRGNFVDNRIIDSRQVTTMEIGNDQTTSPTYTGDLSKAILELIKHEDAHGIYHLVSEGSCTWFYLTKEIFNIMHIDCEVIPVNRGGLFMNTRKPLFSVLSNVRAKDEYNIRLPHWKRALERYLETRYL